MSGGNSFGAMHGSGGSGGIPNRDVNAAKGEASGPDFEVDIRLTGTHLLNPHSGASSGEGYVGETKENEIIVITEEQVEKYLDQLAESNPELRSHIEKLEIDQIKGEIEKEVRKQLAEERKAIGILENIGEGLSAIGRGLSELNPFRVEEAEANPGAIIGGAVTAGREVLKNPVVQKIIRDVATNYVKDIVKSRVLGHDVEKQDGSILERSKNKEKEKQKISKGSSTSGGTMEPDEDPEEGKERIKNPSKADSKIWKELEPYRGNIKTNGLKGKERRYYQWDYTHNDIEVYNSQGDHLGSTDPITGEMYKAPVTSRTIKHLIN